MSKRKRKYRGAEHIVSVSGGKDSTCAYLLALERRERKGVDFTPVFADTGNEHEWTYEFVRGLAEKTGGPEIVEVRANFSHLFARKRKTIREKWPEQGVSDARVEQALKACHPTGNPFLDACLLRAGFPSVRQRYCTVSLKIRPITDVAYASAWRKGKAVINWQGVRAEESVVRRDLRPISRINQEKAACGAEGKVIRYLPIHSWKLADVWRFHRKHGIEPNPLYAQGMSRVGCMPCIMESKKDLRTIAERFPEHIDRIAAWEEHVMLASKTDQATFFQGKRLAGFRPGVEISLERFGIRARAEWAKTTRGGKYMDLLPIDDPKQGLVAADIGTACGEWGVCE